jgi:homoserine O-acetyltransferase
MKAEHSLFTHDAPFALESGHTLPYLKLAYHTWGAPNAEWSNVVWVCHALTANSDAKDWWPGMVGPGCTYDPKDYFIICVNILGSCYGSMGPLEKDPATGQPFYGRFPTVTVRDMVAAHDLLRRYLSVDRIHTLIGGSLGGQQALEWAVLQPQLVQHLVVLATNARHSAWGIAYNTAQRMALEADPTLAEARESAGAAGLEAARAIAMLSYRSYAAYNHTQTDEDDSKLADYRVEGYQRYQGEKLRKRFSAHSYRILSLAMDSHHLGRGRGPLQQVLRGIRARTLAIGISSDGLFPPEEQRFIAQHVPNGQYVEIDSIFGHDGFLVEAAKIRQAIEAFYALAQ